MIGYRYHKYDDTSWKFSQGSWSPVSRYYGTNMISDTPNYFFKNHGGLIVLFHNNFDSQKETNWWYIVKDKFSKIENLPKKTRYMIRRASNIYSTKKVSRKMILKNGFDIYCAAYARYKTHEPRFDLQSFQKAINNMPEQTEFWCVFRKNDEKMVGFCENFIENKFCTFVSLWLHPDEMKKGCGYLLFYEMEEEYLLQRNFSYVSNGTRNLSHSTNIHEFLVSKFNYRKAFCKIHVKYRKPFGLLVSGAYCISKIIFLKSLLLHGRIGILMRLEEIRRES
jgi:hypothetical protein